MSVGPRSRPRRASRRFASFAPLAAAAALVGVPAASALGAGVRVVDADAAVQSHKRGVAANFLGPADFAALSPGVSWWYNYYHVPNQAIPADSGMDYVPMVWTNDQYRLNGLRDYLAAGNRPRQVLVNNEPNLRGQSFITPQASAKLYKDVKAIADPYGVPVSGPQMALGSAPSESITAYDPVQNRTVTYTDMFPFVEATRFYAGSAPVDNIGIHTYGNFGELSYFVDEAQNRFGGPIQVTEFAWWDAPTVADARAYLIKAVDLLERTPGVTDYAWFKERDGFDKISLLTPQPGVLSVLGEAYVNMPVHDADLFYRPNGRLQAERYVSTNGVEIGATGDADGLADMVSTRGGGTIDYQLMVNDAGVYELTLRVAGERGTISVLDDGVAVGSVYANAGAFRTLTLQVPLAEGLRTLRLRFERSGQVINWVNFRAVPEPTSLGAAGLAGVALARRRRR